MFSCLLQRRKPEKEKMEGDSFLGISCSDWIDLLKLLAIVFGISAFLALYVLFDRLLGRLAKKKGGRKKKEWRRYYKSGSSSSNLWDPPLPEVELSEGADDDV